MRGVNFMEAFLNKWQELNNTIDKTIETVDNLNNKFNDLNSTFKEIARLSGEYHEKYHEDNNS